MNAVPQSRIDLFAEMEEHYEKKDTQYFVNLLDSNDYVVRCRATCILVDLGGEDKVEYVAKVLKEDKNELVRHEAAFSLGQMCIRDSCSCPYWLSIFCVSPTTSPVFTRSSRFASVFLSKSSNAVAMPRTVTPSDLYLL